MSLIDRIISASEKLGYRDATLLRDYRFSDVWGDTTTPCRVALAAFTQTPPSYRSAAFGVIEAKGEDAERTVRSLRALGAPVFLVIEQTRVTAWRVHPKDAPEKIAEFATDAVEQFFSERRASWAPDRIHRAKSFGPYDANEQLDFVDLGLIPAIAGEIHVKLDCLIREALSDIREFNGDEATRIFFRGVFRLLAAKILTDRDHERARKWNSDDVHSVLDEMDAFYQLGNVSQAWPASAINTLEPVWQTFRNGFNVANISADDLAFVYESTLVTDKARAEFGTHSTPRHVADYIVGHLRLFEFGNTPPRVYEPFAGAGVLLGSAVRLLRDALPTDWTDRQRHNLLIKQVGGAEQDAFAVEVAKLSLILADYPNANGWKIEEADLFEENVLADCVQGADVILCNPPFEAFRPHEAEAYPQTYKISRSKAVFALEMALRAKPDMLGFVLPNTVLVDRRYRKLRIEIEREFDEIEMVALPDGIFNKSQANSALVIARKSKDAGNLQLIRSSTVFDGDKVQFGATGRPSLVREEKRARPAKPAGNLWIYPSQRLWDRLGNLPRLGHYLRASWGLRWHGGQKGRVNDIPGDHREPGYQQTSSIDQFKLATPQWLDVNPEHILAGSNLPWDEPKILCNATRLSRGYWRLAAAVDRHGHRATQQFMGLWPINGADVDLDALAAIINGPVVNAFMAEHSFDKRFRITQLHDAPLPAEIPAGLGDLARRFVTAARGEGNEAVLNRLIHEIDTVILDAYGLSEDDTKALFDLLGDDRPLAGRPSRRRKAVSQSTARGGLDLLDEHDVGDPLGDVVSRAIGEGLLEALIDDAPPTQWAGLLLTAPQAEDRLSITHDMLTKWVTELRAIAFDDDKGQRVYPADQFDGNAPVHGLRPILSVVQDPKVAWLWLRTPRSATDEPAPLDLLRAGKLGRAEELAKRDFG